MNQQEFRTMFGSTPDSFKAAVRRGLASARAEKTAARRPLRVLASAAAAMLLVMGAAYAAFPSQVAEWFGRSYGEQTAAWLKDGKTDRPANVGIVAGGAVFTLDEVVQRNRGLYGVGTVTLPEGSKDVLVAEDQGVDEPFGYDIHGMGDHAEAAPEGTATLAETAKKRGGKLLMAVFRLDMVGVDGGEMLAPDCVGYTMIPQRDGSLRFLFEAEEGIAIEEGDSYRLALRANTREIDESGAYLEGTKQETAWELDIAPKAAEK